MAPTKPLTHLECLSKLCIICFEKVGHLETLSENLSFFLQEDNIVENVDANHNPKSICNSCRTDYQKPDSAKILKERRKAAQPSVDELICFNLNGICECKICQIVKKRPPPPPKSKNKGGRPKKRSVSLVCSKCMDPECSGINCQGKKVKESASKVIAANPKIAQAITSQMIKQTNPSPKGTIRLPQGSGGGDLPITIGSSAKKPKKVEVSANEVNELSQKIGIGIKQTREVTKFLNKKVGKGTVESGHQTKLVDMKHVLDGHFTLQEEFQFLDSEKKFVHKPLVHVEDLSDFVLCIIDGRGYDRDATQVLFNVDNSENFSEYWITILNLNEDPDAPLKSSGSSHALLVAVSEKVPENHYNFGKVLKAMKAHKVKMLFPVDIKALLILIGNQSASCKHPCPYCFTSDLSEEGEPRTIGTMCEQNRLYNESGADRKDLKEYKNCEFLPLITDDYEADKDVEVLDLCPPAGLHIMLGIVNQNVKLLEKVVPHLVEEWVAYSQAPRVAYQGGVFEGNGCKKLVDNVDYLQMVASNDPGEHTAFVMSIVDVLRKFRKVRHSCFSKELLPDFEDHLDNYNDAHTNVVSDHDVSMILKSHITKFHVKKWCLRNKVGLGARSEQYAEASHSRFLKVWPRYKASGKNVGKQMLKAACAINSDNSHFVTATISCPHTIKLVENQDNLQKT